MRKLLMMTLASAALATTAPIAAAQGWRSINQRQANLDQRIDAGVRDGSLTRAEANNLRAQYRDIANLEARYRRGGLSFSERRDLDRRFNNLSTHIRYQRHDNELRRRHAININQRQAHIRQRITAGEHQRQISWLEARRLNNDYNDIARLELRYRRDGLQPAERRYLNTRLDSLSRDVNNYRHDEDFLWF